MPFIGNQPALAYTSFAKQDFTTSATTSYTLDNPVTNANELALFINFVRQEPTTAYSASGTSLTLTSATASSDDMYCVFLGKAVQTVNPPNASVGLSQLTASGTKDATTFLRGDNTFAAAGGGKVLQVLTATDTTTRSSTSTSFVTASNSLSVDITPSATSSKIFVQVSFEALTNSGARGFWTIYKDSTDLGDSNGMASIDQSVDGGSVSMTFLDSPSSTSELTYAVYIKTNGTSCSMNANNTKGSIVVMEIGA